MARSEYIYACGHGTGTVYGHNRDAANRKAAWCEANVYCAECKQHKAAEEREKQNKAAAKYAKKMKLPVLEGTEKQMVWANTIRSTVMTQLEAAQSGKPKTLEPADEEHLLQLYSYLVAQTSAKWWIETKDYQSPNDPLRMTSALLSFFSGGRGHARNEISLATFAAYYVNRQEEEARAEIAKEVAAKRRLKEQKDQANVAILRKIYGNVEIHAWSPAGSNPKYQAERLFIGGYGANLATYYRAGDKYHKAGSLETYTLTDDQHAQAVAACAELVLRLHSKRFYPEEETATA